MRPGLGRVPHWDVRNEQHALSVPIVRRVGFAVARALRLSQPRDWRQWLRFDQGPTPECTAFGSATFLAADPIHQVLAWLRTLDIHAWYRDNVAEDRAHGRNFDEGASVLAAMEVGKRRGYWDKYEWELSFDGLRAWVHDQAPLIAGTNWYESQWQRDSEGICRIRPTSRLAGGHLYTLRGFDPKRDLYRMPSTWGDGDYLIPGEDLRRLHAEDGEFVFPHELKVDLSILPILPIASTVTE